MNRLLIALAASAVMSTAAFAQATTNPVPGTSAGETSVMPADAAGTVIVEDDAPTASTTAGTSQVPVPGNDSGVSSAMPADAASTVIVPSDAASVPKGTSVPVPGTSAGDDSVTKTN